MTPTVTLLVDDETAFVETMSKRLSKRGLEVQTAFSGQDALDKLAADRSDRIDVVVLDVKMPGMDGLETLMNVKRVKPLVEVIMLTGHATIESAIEGMKLGAFDYLMKPSDMEVLLSKIDQACHKKRQHEAKITQARAEMIAMRRGD